MKVFWAAVKEVCGKSLIFTETIVKVAQLGSQFGRNKLYARIFPFKLLSFMLGLSVVCPARLILLYLCSGSWPSALILQRNSIR